MTPPYELRKETMVLSTSHRTLSYLSGRRYSLYSVDIVKGGRDSPSWRAVLQARQLFFYIIFLQLQWSQYIYLITGMFEEDSESQFFSIVTNNLNNMEDFQSYHRVEKSHDAYQREGEFETTLQTTKMSMINKNEADLESCFGQFADIVSTIPQDMLPNKIQRFPSPKKKLQPHSSKSISRFSSPYKSYWTGENQLRCLFEHQGRSEQVVISFKNGELVIVDGGCRFKLEQIGKIKTVYENYQRCLWITYDEETKNRSTQQVKFRISLQNDSRDQLYLLFAKIVVAKLTLLEYEIDQSHRDNLDEDRFMMTGILLKKSQYLGRWDERRMVITERIQSFKEEVCTFEIAGVRELWTRFEVHKDCLVVKVRHGMAKTELAIPIVNYCGKFCKDNWLYRIYRLVSAFSV